MDSTGREIYPPIPAESDKISTEGGNIISIAPSLCLMGQDDEWTSYKVQGHSDDHWRLTVQKHYGDRYDHLDEKIEGEYLIARPAGRDPLGGERSRDLVIGDELLQSERPESRLLDLLQCYCLGNVDEVNIGYRDGTDEESREALERLLREMEHATYWEWDDQESVFRFDEKDVDFNKYIENVRKFLDKHFLDALTTNRIDEISDNTHLEQANLKRDHRESDKRWALSGREATETFTDIKPYDFPKATGQYFIGKYLEHLTDRTEKCITALHHIYTNADRTYAEELRGELQDAFNEPVRFDTQIQEIASQSIEGDIGLDRVIQEEGIREERKQRLDQAAELLATRDPPENQGEILLKTGEIITHCHDLTRTPRSISLVGLGIEHTPNAPNRTPGQE